MVVIQPLLTRLIKPNFHVSVNGCTRMSDKLCICTSHHDMILWSYKVHKDNFNTSPLLIKQQLIKMLTNHWLFWSKYFSDKQVFKICVILTRDANSLCCQNNDGISWLSQNGKVGIELNILQTIQSHQWDHAQQKKDINEPAHEY